MIWIVFGKVEAKRIISPAYIHTKRLIWNILSLTEALACISQFKNKNKTQFSSSSAGKINDTKLILSNIPAHKVGDIIKKCIQAITNLM